MGLPLMSILVKEAPRAPHGELVPRSLRGIKDWGLTQPKRSAYYGQGHYRAGANCVGQKGRKASCRKLDIQPPTRLAATLGALS